MEELGRLGRLLRPEACVCQKGAGERHGQGVGLVHPRDQGPGRFRAGSHVEGELRAVTQEAALRRGLEEKYVPNNQGPCQIAEKVASTDEAMKPGDRSFRCRR